MIGITKTKIGNLLFSLTLALASMPGAYSFEIARSDIAAYRSQVVRKVFDAVKNSSEYKRTVIELSINAMGKITSCKVIKSSGDPNLDAKMMQALTEVSLEPIKFASSSLDSMRIQIIFANAVPDPTKLLMSDNELLAYEGHGTAMYVRGPSPMGEQIIGRRSISRRTPFGERLQTAGPSIQGQTAATITSDQSVLPAAPDHYTKSDKSYDDEVSKLLSDSHAELTFHSVRFGLTDAPQSTILVDQAIRLTEKGQYLQAAHSYILALIEPIRAQKIDAVNPIADKLRKLSPRLSGDERLNVAISLINFHHRVRSLLPFHANEEIKGALNTVLPLAQQFADDSHTKQMGRLARYYRLRGEIFKAMHDQDKAKIAYQKYLSIMLENDDAQPAEVEQAFEKTLESLHSRDDKAAIQEVESQRQVWLSKHQDPTNLRAIAFACGQLESNLTRFPSVSTASNETDDAIKQILKLISTSTLYTQPVPERFFPPSEFIDGRTSPNQSEEVNRCLQKLLQVNDRLFLLGRVTTPDNLVEQLFKESYKFSLKTHNALQKRAFQRLTEYLIKIEKAQEALVLCDLVGTKADTEESTSRLRYASSNPVDQLRIKALQALGRNAEADKLLAELKAEREKKTQLSVERSVDSVARQVENATPYSSERIQSRITLIANLLALPSVQSLQKAKSAFLDNVNEVSSEKCTAYSVNTYRELSNQLTEIISKCTEPDLDFATKAYESLFLLQYTKSAKVFQNQGTVERALPIGATLDNSAFAKEPKTYITLMRTLTAFCREHKALDDTNLLILLRKLAELEIKDGELENTVKTNLEIVALLENKKDPDHTQLVSQYVAMAIAEASANRLSLARRYQQRASDLSYATAEPNSMNESLSNLSNLYARHGALKDARLTLLQVSKRLVDLGIASRTVSTRELQQACEKQRNFSEAEGFFEDAIGFAQNREKNSVIVNLYRIDLADLLLKEYGLASGTAQKERLLKQSDVVFDQAADGLVQTQGPDSSTLGTAVHRRAFQLALSGLNDKGEALMEKYRGAASHSAGVTITDVDVPIPE